MNDALDFLKNLPASKWAMVLGSVGIIASALTHGIFGYEVEDEMKLAVLVISAIILVMGLYTNLKTKQLDVELREKRMEQGLPPEKDETIFKS